MTKAKENSGLASGEVLTSGGKRKKHKILSEKSLTVLRAWATTGRSERKKRSDAGELINKGFKSSRSAAGVAVPERALPSQ